MSNKRVLRDRLFNHGRGRIVVDLTPGASELEPIVIEDDEPIQIVISDSDMEDETTVTEETEPVNEEPSPLVLELEPTGQTFIILNSDVHFETNYDHSHLNENDWDEFFASL